MFFETHVFFIQIKPIKGIFGHLINFTPKKNMFGKLAEAKKMATEMKTKLAAITVESSVYNNQISVVANGNREIIDIKIAPEVLSNLDAVQISNYVKEACNQALISANNVAESEMKSMMGGLMPGLGGMFS
jgi:DNA-binding protein YbaB